jgi:hypothetical protein
MKFKTIELVLKLSYLLMICRTVVFWDSATLYYTCALHGTFFKHLCFEHFS